MDKIKNASAKTETGKLSDKTIKHYHTLLNTMFNDAVKFDIIPKNPMEHVTVRTPRQKVKDNYYDIEDINQLLDLLSTAPIKYQLAVNLALTTGMRLGELTGLQWKHIDFDNLTIKIEQANSHTTREGTIIKDTKTDGSDRTVVFPSSLLPLFKQHKENELLKRESMEDKWINKDDTIEDFVFTQRDGKVIFIGTIPRWFREFIRKHKLKEITFHGLRHTNATILINEGINVVSISHMLGHSNTSTTTNIYAHHLESVERKAADKFDNILSGSRGGSDNDKIRIIK